MLTPARRRRKAMADAYYATVNGKPGDCAIMAAHFMEKALAAAGYKVVKIRELRQQAAEDGAASQAAGSSASP